MASSAAVAGSLGVAGVVVIVLSVMLPLPGETSSGAVVGSLVGPTVGSSDPLTAGLGPTCAEAIAGIATASATANLSGDMLIS